MNSIFPLIWGNYIGKLIYCLLLGFTEYLNVNVRFSQKSQLTHSFPLGIWVDVKHAYALSSAILVPQENGVSPMPQYS